MQSRFFGLLASLMLAGVACAKGFGGLGGAGGAGPADTSAGTGNATATGSTAASTTGASTSTTASASNASSASSTGSGAPCADNPCKLTDPQCGCDVGKECSIDGTGTRACIKAGTALWGQVCGVEQCSPGLICLLTSPTVSTCGKFCDTDIECKAPGGICVIQLNDAMSMIIPGVTLCSDNCDPATNMGCTVPGTGCQVGQEPLGMMRWFTACRGAGNLPAKATCKGDDCAPGSGCFKTGAGNKCLKYCVVSNPGSCPGGTCTSLAMKAIIGNTEYGVCQ